MSCTADDFEADTAGNIWVRDTLGTVTQADWDASVARPATDRLSVADALLITLLKDADPDAYAAYPQATKDRAAEICGDCHTELLARVSQ